jgi:tRNA threonylcarbamoyl adenosine modification protein YeaZ
MLILALDTTGEAGGVSIFRDQECLACAMNDGPANRYAVSLFYLLDRAIQEARVKHGVLSGGLAEIGLIAVATGPGSFTGIRVGLAAAKGWARAFGMPVRGVAVLEALVEAAGAQPGWTMPVLDAHRGEFFVALFHRPANGETGGQAALAARHGWILKPAEMGHFMASRLPAGVETRCPVRESDRAAMSLRESLTGPPFQWQAVPGTLLQAVARLGLRDYRSGRDEAAGDLDALYIRRPDAELLWKG